AVTDLMADVRVRAARAGGKPPYDAGELGQLADHCTKAEDAANKVERQVRKSAAAYVLKNRVGEKCAGIVTGASAKGTWVRVFHPPVEGKVVHGANGLDIGHRVRVKLVDVDVERGFIDFARAHK